MKKGKEPAEYTNDDEPTKDHSEEEENMYITNLEKEEKKLRNDNRNTTERIKLSENECQLLRIEKQHWKTIRQQSLEENRRLEQECIYRENLQQEQSRAPNAAQDPNSMLEPRQIQTSGPSHQHAHQLGGHHNAAYPSYGIMVPQQIQTSGPFDQQAHQPGGPHNAAYHSSGIMVPQQIQTSGQSHQQAHQPGGPHNAAYHSSGIMVPQQIQTSGLSHRPGGPHNAAHHSYGLQEPGMRELGQSSASQKGVYDNPRGTWVAWVESCINDSDQDVPSPQLSADDSVLGSEMPSTAQLQEGMSSTDVEKAKSDAGQIE